MYYARVTIMAGKLVHLAAVETRNRPFMTMGLKTLCGQRVADSIEGSSDPADCRACLRREKDKPLERRSIEG